MSKTSLLFSKSVLVVDETTAIEHSTGDIKMVPFISLYFQLKNITLGKLHEKALVSETSKKRLLPCFSS